MLDNEQNKVYEYIKKINLDALQTRRVDIEKCAKDLSLIKSKVQEVINYLEENNYIHISSSVSDVGDKKLNKNKALIYISYLKLK